MIIRANNAKSLWLLAAVAIFSAAAASAAEIGKAARSRLDHVQESLTSDIPRVLCLDENFATGAQPTGEAYTKAAAQGFRSVLNLRTANEGIDLARERAKVESAGMRFFNIPIDSAAPRAEQADEFIRLSREKANHPMLVTCASANRVGAFMMIQRVLDQGWSEDQAFVEATKVGLRSDKLKRFAQDYIAAHKSRRF